MKRILIIIAAVAVIVPLGIWWLSPERVIKRQTKHLMSVLSLSSGTTPTLRQTKVFSLGRMLARDLEIVSPTIPKAEGTFQKDIAESAFSWICRNAKESEFKVTEFRSLEIEGERATVMVEVDGFMELPSYRPVDGKYEVTIYWLNADDGWRFDKIIWETPTL